MYSSQIYKRQEKAKKMSIDAMLALVELKKRGMYDNFAISLDKLIHGSKAKNSIYKIYDVLLHNKKWVKEDFKTFVNENKEGIEILREYNCLCQFTLEKYTYNNKIRQDYALDSFASYISEDNLPLIERVVKKIKSLEINIVYFGDVDYKDDTYQVSKYFDSDFQVLDNMQIIPSYDTEPITYGTAGSNYCIHLRVNSSHSKKEISKCGRSIEVNSFLFDPDRLPQDLSVENTYGKIEKMAKEETLDYQTIKNAVDLDVSTKDVRVKLVKLKSVIERIGKTNEANELYAIVLKMNEDLNELEEYNDILKCELLKYTNHVDDISIEKEKEQYIKMRNMPHID